MSLVGFRAQNHRQQTDRRGPNPLVDDRQTSPEVFALLQSRFRFTVDVAASAANAKLDRFYSLSDDGLAQSWAGERVWCNPPYSAIGPWVEKAWSEAAQAELIVLLVPANRTEQAWWQDHVEPALRRRDPQFACEFLRGRMRFIAPDALEVKPNDRPPFGVCLLIWNPTS